MRRDEGNKSLLSLSQWTSSFYMSCASYSPGVQLHLLLFCSLTQELTIFTLSVTLWLLENCLFLTFFQWILHLPFQMMKTGLRGAKFYIIMNLQLLYVSHRTINSIDGTCWVKTGELVICVMVKKGNAPCFKREIFWIMIRFTAGTDIDKMPQTEWVIFRPDWSIAS